MTAPVPAQSRAARTVSVLFVIALFVAVGYFGLTAIPAAQRPHLVAPLAPTHATHSATHPGVHSAARTATRRRVGGKGGIRIGGTQKRRPSHPGGTAAVRGHR